MTIKFRLVDRTTLTVLCEFHSTYLHELLPDDLVHDPNVSNTVIDLSSDTLSLLELGSNNQDVLKELSKHFSSYFIALDNPTPINERFMIHKIANISLILPLAKTLQSLIASLIDIASEIDYEDERWCLYILSQKTPNGSMIVGVCSAYKFSLLFEKDKYRLRIAQFVIWPTFQGQGYGTILYTWIMSDALNDASVKEVVVEAASKEFDSLRLKSDYIRYLSDGEKTFNKLAKEQKERLKMLIEYQNSKSNLQTIDEFRIRYKRYLLRIKEVPDDIIQRKSLLQLWYEQDCQVFDRVLTRV